MTITKLKSKNQLTIPQTVVAMLHLKKNELFAVDVEKNFIKLTPVTVSPRYTEKELKAVDAVVAREKSSAKKFAAGKGLSAYLKKL